MGSCGETLASGASCQPVCLPTYYATGPSSCKFGNLTAAACRGLPGRHMVVVGNKDVWRNHTSGNKLTTCALNNEVKTDQTNQFGDAIGVTCCSADGTWGTRPDCKKSVGREEAKTHCE